MSRVRVGECTYGVRICCRECKCIVVVESIIGKNPQCPACDSYNVEELFTHFYSSAGELIQKTSVELVPINAVRLSPEARGRYFHV